MYSAPIAICILRTYERCGHQRRRPVHSVRTTGKAKFDDDKNFNLKNTTNISLDQVDFDDDTHLVRTSTKIPFFFFVQLFHIDKVDILEQHKHHFSHQRFVSIQKMPWKICRNKRKELHGLEMLSFERCLTLISDEHPDHHLPLLAVTTPAGSGLPSPKRASSFGL